jgi:UDP-N-acetylmuramoyl-tripeptide--D-alanyl-D-alanine ligase
LEVLRHARDCGIEAVHVSGQWMSQACDALRAAGEPVPRYWADVDAMAADWALAIQQDNKPPASLLVKGSRFMRMERVVRALQASAQPTQRESSHVA